MTNSAPCVDIETSPHCDPLADLFNSGGSLWHSIFAEEPCDRVDLCGGRALRGVPVDLNTVYARHREFLRIRVHLAQTINSLGPASAFPYAFPFVSCRYLFPRCGFDPQVGG